MYNTPAGHICSHKEVLQVAAIRRGKFSPSWANRSRKNAFETFAHIYHTIVTQTIITTHFPPGNSFMSDKQNQRNAQCLLIMILISHRHRKTHQKHKWFYSLCKILHAIRSIYWAFRFVRYAKNSLWGLFVMTGSTLYTFTKRARIMEEY